MSLIRRYTRFFTLTNPADSNRFQSHAWKPLLSKFSNNNLRRSNFFVVNWNVDISLSDVTLSYLWLKISDNFWHHHWTHLYIEFISIFSFYGFERSRTLWKFSGYANRGGIIFSINDILQKLKKRFLLSKNFLKISN